MYTVSQLVKVLGLSTENQVRNRMEAIRDLLAGHIRRGPNNQVLLTDEGVTLLKDLQALCETGYTLTQAAEAMRHRAQREKFQSERTVDQTGPRSTPPAQGSPGWEALLQHLMEDMRRLEERVAALEQALRAQRHMAWWEAWR